MNQRRPKRPRRKDGNIITLKDYHEMWFNHDIHLEYRTLYFGSPGSSLDSDENEINAAAAERIIKGLLILEAEDAVKAITFIMNSPGGDCIHAMGIYDAIKAIKCPVVVKIFGHCMSAAAVILQAASERLISPNSSMLLHDGSAEVSGHPRDIERWSKWMKEDGKRMYEIFSSRTGKSPKYWEKKCERDLILTAQQALKEGLVDKIIKNEK